MFITFEGADGSGKTTQIQLLADFLKHSGHTVYITREPGGTMIGDQIREVILSMKNESMHPRTETLLFCASRAQLVEQELRPRLARHEIVICDRYTDSTLAYQGYAHGNDLTALRSLLTFVTGDLKPDLTLLFDIDVTVGLNRRKTSGVEWNRLDAFQVAFHQKVREGYLELARQEPLRWQVINAAQSIEQVSQHVQQIITDYLTGQTKTESDRLGL